MHSRSRGAALLALLVAVAALLALLIAGGASGGGAPPVIDLPEHADARSLSAGDAASLASALTDDGFAIAPGDLSRELHHLNFLGTDLHLELSPDTMAQIHVLDPRTSQPQAPAQTMRPQMQPVMQPGSRR